MPLNQIIREQVRYEQQEGSFDGVAHTIRNLMEGLETEIRHRYVKLVRAYIDVLREVLCERGASESAEVVPPLHLFLECGASSVTALSLLSVGISRTTSLLLRRQMEFPEDSSPEQCRGIIRSTNLDELGIPELSKKELREVIWGSS